MKKNPRIYLAGPISNCNDRQQHEWRDEIVKRWREEFDFEDPTRMPGGDLTPFDIAEADKKAIERSDAILANMWKESIGTAIGIAHAAYAGKPAFVVDPNRLENRAMVLYAYAIVSTPAEGMRRIREYFRLRERVKAVIKRKGPEESFQPAKIFGAIRRACRAAGQDDVIVPAKTVPEVLGRLPAGRSRLAGAVSTTAIRDAVWEVLSEFEADPRWSDSFTGIRAAWETYDRKRRPGLMPPIDKSARVSVHEQPLSVRFVSLKSHATVWGRPIRRLADIPKSARRIFEEIARVEGIAEIRFGPFTGPRSRTQAGASVSVFSSRQVGIIEGKCYDSGQKGSVQMFQIRIHDVRRTEAVRQTTVEHLGRCHLLSSPMQE